MKIQCPKCGSVFKLDESNLSSNENRFRCYKCGYMWVLNLLKYRKTHDKEIRKPYKNINRNAINLQSFDFRSWLLVLSVTLFVILSFLLVSNRAFFIRKLKKISLTTFNSKKILKTDLEIEVDIPIPTIRRDNKDFLIIKGRIINRTFKSQKVPPILIELKNKEKNILLHVSKNFHKNYVDPDSSENFTFVIEKYSQAISNANIHFDLQKQK